jgi:hypothetical protein
MIRQRVKVFPRAERIASWEKVCHEEKTEKKESANDLVGDGRVGGYACVDFCAGYVGRYRLERKTQHLPKVYVA